MTPHRGQQETDVTDQRDDFYQPWLREPPTPAPTPAAAPKRRYEPAPDAGLARDDAVPLGVDVSRYVLDEAPPVPVAERVKPAARAASDHAARLWASARRGAASFADWTIRMGERADVPAKVAALEIPRRTGVAAHRTGAALGSASRTVAAATHRAAGVAQRELGDAANRAGSGIKQVAARGVTAGGERLAGLRPQPKAEGPEPTSGLDRLLESEAAASVPKTADAASLPLFSAAPPVAAPPSPTPPSHTPPSPAPPPPAPITHASADERPARASGPTSAGSGFGGAFGGGVGQLPRWVPWGAAALLVLALTFWLGSRWGGGTMDRPAMEALVKDVILANPEIIPQALEKHQANQMATAIAAVRPVLEKPFSGAWAGNAKGDVTVTVFTDYGCVYCRASIADIDRLVRADKGVKLVYRELPIIAPQSKDAALAALAAARQGKYDAFHHAMFAAPGLDRASIEAASTRAGVILDGRSDAGVDTRLFEREIDNNLALAQQIGVNATPTWIIGSKMLQGAVGFDELKQAVAAARAAN